MNDGNDDELQQKNLSSERSSSDESLDNRKENFIGLAKSNDTNCPFCTPKGQSNRYVYALGKIKIRFPDPSIENEYKQIISQHDTANKTENDILYEILKENYYLAREICWVLTIEEIDTYFLVPRSAYDLEQLIEGIKPSKERDLRIDTNVIIGEVGPLASPVFCNGIILPLVTFDKIYSFSATELIKALTKPKHTDKTSFLESSEELFTRIQQMADNIGASNEHRALNYLAVRYDRIYHLLSDMYAQDYSLEEINVLPSRLIGTRKILDPVFIYVNRKTDVKEKYFVRVDVTGKYPFIHTKLSRYFDRI